MKALLFTDILKSDIGKKEEKRALYIGLNVTGVDELAIEGGEDPKDFHVTLLYGYYNPGGGDEDDNAVRIQSAIDEIADMIPETLSFNTEDRFEASGSSDGKDVIFAKVEVGQLEDVHEALLKALKKNGITVEKTFEKYQPHMTLAYIDPEEEYELGVLYHEATIKNITYGFGEESTHDNEYKYNINKSPEERPSVAKTFEEIIKFNPYHDKLGRFSSANGYASFTYSPGKSKAHDNAIAREKERQAAAGGADKKDKSDNSFHGTLYHGSPNADIKEFDMKHAGKNTSSGEKLLFFTDSKQMADDFSYERLEGSTKFHNVRGKKGRVYEVEVDMKKPLDFRNLSDKDIDNILKLDEDGIMTREDVKMMASKNHQLLKAGLNISAESLKSLGYDGLIANTGKAGHNSLEYAVVSSKQTKIIKSTDNTQQFNIMKTDDDKRLIFGWASVAIKVDGEQVVDHQKDMIDPEDLEEAVYEYVLNFRDGGEEHIENLRKKARMVESCMFTKEKMAAMGIPEGIVPEGWWIGFYVDDDDAWEKVKNGTYQMFSIEGQGVREEVEDDE